MNWLHEFFEVNRPIVLFVYGQTFMVMGLAIFLQSRRHSRLQLARDLRWLALFGVLHAVHEWGDVFIPIQATYLPEPYTALLRILQVLLLAASFVALLAFGVVTLAERWPRGRWAASALVLVWAVVFWIALYLAPTIEETHHLASTWARYLLGFPGGLLAAYGLRYQARTRVAPLGVAGIYDTLRLAGLTLFAYAILGGLVVEPAAFFPASVLNRANVVDWIGIPVEVLRSVAGLALAVSMIRALEVFEVEMDRLIEGMEVERIQAAERDRIGQEIHDGAIQAVYSASLVLESIHQTQDFAEAQVRVDRAERILKGAVSDLRRYMVSLRADVLSETLQEGLLRLAQEPRFSSLIEVRLRLEEAPALTPISTGHILAIVQESLSNSIRHGRARCATVGAKMGGRHLVVTIEDDGQGFDPARTHPGYGLRVMHDRARLLGGELRIHSQPGQPTATTLRIPQENL